MQRTQGTGNGIKKKQKSPGKKTNPQKQKSPLTKGGQMTTPTQEAHAEAKDLDDDSSRERQVSAKTLSGEKNVQLNKRKVVGTSLNKKKSLEEMFATNEETSPTAKLPKGKLCKHPKCSRRATFATLDRDTPLCDTHGKDLGHKAYPINRGPL
jgi:hypothetical protein